MRETGANINMETAAAWLITKSVRTTAHGRPNEHRPPQRVGWALTGPSPAGRKHSLGGLLVGKSYTLPTRGEGLRRQVAISAAPGSLGNQAGSTSSPPRGTEWKELVSLSRRERRVELLNDTYVEGGSTRKGNRLRCISRRSLIPAPQPHGSFLADNKTRPKCTWANRGMHQTTHDTSQLSNPPPTTLFAHTTTGQKRW